MKQSRTKRTKGTQPQWVVEECQVTKPETLHSFMTWVGSPFGGPLVFGETRRVDAYIQNERVTWRTTVEIQPDNVSQSTFDLGGFPFALHITQASTASATAFLHFSHPPSLIMQYAKGAYSKNTSSRHRLPVFLHGYDWWSQKGSRISKNPKRSNPFRRTQSE